MGRSLLIGALLLAVNACSSGREVTAQNNKPDEIPPGPGVFSGEDGAFIIYRR